MKIAKGSLGGKATAILLKKKALEKYLNDPAFCKECQKIIPLDVSKQKASAVKKRVFCSKECHAKRVDAQKIASRIKRYPRRFLLLNKNCAHCQSLFLATKKQKHCSSSCARTATKIKNTKIDWSSLTKGFIFSNNEDRHKSRVKIRKNAHKVFASQNKPRHCHVCQYSRKVEICHIKPIKDFALTATMSEINHPDNLVALCANHHWELDHDLLDAPLIFLDNFVNYQ